MEKCSNNQTNIGQMITDADAIIEYGQACACCAFSAYISAYVLTRELKLSFSFNLLFANGII